MSQELAFPPAVVLGLWLNAAVGASVSATDAANALETITDQTSIGGHDNSVAIGPMDISWVEVVRQAVAMKTPVAVGLPVDGDPAGVPTNVLRMIDRDFGVVALSKNLLLVRSLDSVWKLEATVNTVVHYDLNQTRRTLTEQVSIITSQLAASDLTGDESAITKLLDEFRALQLPPHLSKRSAEALETAAKIQIVARGALMHSAALHSPSTDRIRMKTLEDLIANCRAVLQSVVIA